MIDDDYMELGDSGVVPIAEGWLLDTRTGNRISPDGKVFNSLNELIWSPDIEEALQDDE